MQCQAYHMIATTSLKFELLPWKGWCKMLIGGDYINNDVITLGMYFSMFVYIRARFHSTLIGRNLTAQSRGSHRGIGGKFKFQRCTAVVASSPFFFCPTFRVPQRHCSQARTGTKCLSYGKSREWRVRQVQTLGISLKKCILLMVFTVMSSNCKVKKARFYEFLFTLDWR